MPAFVKWGTGAGQADVREVPVPRAGPGEVLLRVEACGLCGSDVHAVRGDHGYEWVRPPVVLGHEAVGWVAEVGAGVDPALRGRRAGVVSIRGCRCCPVCDGGQPQLCPDRTVMGLSGPGAATPWVTVPAHWLVPLPEDLPRRVAVLLEPLSVAVRAAEHHGEVAAGQRVVVSGPGPIGLLAALVCQARCADVLVVGTTRDETVRLPAARRLGLRTAIGGTATRPDLWIEASGAPAAMAAAVHEVRTGGRVVAVGLFAEAVTLDLTAAVRREVRILTSYGSAPPDYAIAAKLLAGPLREAGALVTEFPLAEAPAALAAAEQARVVKPVVVAHGPAPSQSSSY